MELHGDRLIPAPVDTTWAALNDPETLKACIAGCESLECTGDDAYTAVVALAHVGHIDDEALKLAMRSECFYVGALGSRRNHAKRTQRLKDAGFSDAEIKRIHSPIGINIGAQSPQEIAISIMAELVLALRGPKVYKPADAPRA